MTVKPTKKPKTKSVKSSSSSAANKKKVKTTSKTDLLCIIAHVASMHGGVGGDGAPPDLVARRAGYSKANSPAFKMAIRRAVKSGHVDDSNKAALKLTEAGQAEVDQVAPVVKVAAGETNAAAHERIRNSDLSPKMQQVFDLCQDGMPHLRSELAVQLGYPNEKEAGFKILLSRIRDKGYMDFVGKDAVQLSDICFPEGRPFEE